MAVLFWVLLASAGLMAADTPRSGLTATPAATTSTALGGTLLLGVPLQPGDVIDVNVVGEPQITGQYSIREDGQVIFPILGATKVVGFTATQLADELTRLLKPFVVNPVVAVTPVSAAPRVVSVLGEVANPGVYDLRQAPSLLALLAMAGNATPAGDMSGAVLLRRGETIKLIPEGMPGLQVPRDIPLEPGDAIMVPSRDLQGVYVMGAVKVPGLMPLDRASTAGRAIIMAGGPLPEGDAAAAYVMRGNSRLPIDLSPYTQATPVGAAELDLALEAGDVLMVPTRSDATVYVVGEVRTPGPQPYVRSPLASAAVTLAGGLTEFAYGNEAYILRQGQKVAVDLRAILEQGKAENDQAMHPGDVLVVPRQAKVFYLVGQVMKPGPQPLDMARDVMSAWAMAGGATPEADLTNAVLLRNAQTMPLDLEALVDRGDMKYNLTLEPGDQIIVPRTLDEVYVLGQVLRPGTVPLHKGDTLLDIIARAGGPSPMGNADAIAVVRRMTPDEAAAQAAANKTSNVQGGKPTAAQQLQEKIDKGLSVKLMDLAKVQAGEEVYVARAGDLVYVPPVPQKGRDWVSMLVSLATGLLLAN